MFQSTPIDSRVATFNQNTFSQVFEFCHERNLTESACLVRRMDSTLTNKSKDCNFQCSLLRLPWHIVHKLLVESFLPTPRFSLHLQGAA